MAHLNPAQRNFSLDPKETRSSRALFRSDSSGEFSERFVECGPFPGRVPECSSAQRLVD
jgi:hypothetical protein